MAQQRRTRDEWRALAREHRKSGLGVTEFARTRGIRPRTFGWWLWKLGSDRTPTKRRRRPRIEPVRMLPVSVIGASRPESSARLEVSLGAISLRFGAETDPSYVAALVRSLEARAC